MGSGTSCELHKNTGRGLRASDWSIAEQDFCRCVTHRCAIFRLQVCFFKVKFWIHDRAHQCVCSCVDIQMAKKFEIFREASINLLFFERQWVSCNLIVVSMEFQTLWLKLTEIVQQHSTRKRISFHSLSLNFSFKYHKCVKKERGFDCHQLADLPPFITLLSMKWDCKQHCEQRK